MANVYEQVAEQLRVSPRKPNWQAIPCPFHKDSSPSAAINFEFGMFTCHAGCGSMPIPRLAQRLGIEGGEATRFLAQQEIFKMDIEQNGYPLISIKTEVNELYAFLASRKLKMETITKWGGWYCTDQANKELLYGHLVFRCGKGYTARRILDIPSANRFNNKKGFDKSLFGKENFKSFESKDWMVLVEGITDFLTMDQLEYKNVVCSMGADVSDEQCYLLRGKTIFIIFDRDYAGYAGALKASEKLRQYHATPVIVELPDNGKEKNDINEMYCTDETELVTFLRSALTRHSTYDNEYLTRAQVTKTSRKLWPVGIPMLDRTFGGVRPHDNNPGGMGVGVYAYGGEEGIGKSTLVVHAADSCVNAGARVLLCSYELPKHQLWARFASRYSQYSWVELEQDMSLLSNEPEHEALTRLSNNLKIEVGITMDQITAARNSFDVVIVDYLQRMPSTVAGEREALIANNRAISEFMSNYNKTVLLITSIARAGYGHTQELRAKGTGDVEYTVQGSVRVAKIGSKFMSFFVAKNTRGESSQTAYASVNWEHQTLKDSQGTEFLQALEKDQKHGQQSATFQFEKS